MSSYEEKSKNNETHNFDESKNENIWLETF